MMVSRKKMLVLVGLAAVSWQAPALTKASNHDADTIKVSTTEQSTVKIPIGVVIGERQQKAKEPRIRVAPEGRCGPGGCGPFDEW